MQLGDRTLGQCSWDLIHIPTTNRHIGLCAFISILLSPLQDTCVPDTCLSWLSMRGYLVEHTRTNCFVLYCFCLFACLRQILTMADLNLLCSWGWSGAQSNLWTLTPTLVFYMNHVFSYSYTWSFLDKDVTFCKHIVTSPISPEDVQNSIKHTLLGLPL